MVVTVPAPLVVQRDDKQVGSFEILQGFLPGSRRSGALSTPLQNSITKRATQAVENRRAQQESLDALGLLLQDFLNQIVHHEPVASAERLDEAGSISMSLH